MCSRTMNEQRQNHEISINNRFNWKEENKQKTTTKIGWNIWNGFFSKNSIKYKKCSEETIKPNCLRNWSSVTFKIILTDRKCKFIFGIFGSHRLNPNWFYAHAFVFFFFAASATSLCCITAVALLFRFGAHVLLYLCVVGKFFVSFTSQQITFLLNNLLAITNWIKPKFVTIHKSNACIKLYKMDLEHLWTLSHTICYWNCK